MKTDLRYDYELIRRYWSGEMTNAERYALEKAALEDPMLADAMEGYADRPVAEMQTDLADLQSRLTKPNAKELAPVVQMKKTNWLRYAAVLLVTVGIAGLLFKMNSGGDEEKQIVQVDPVKKDTLISPATDELNKRKFAIDSSKNQLTSEQISIPNSNIAKVDQTVPFTIDQRTKNNLTAKPATDVTVLTFNEPKTKKELAGNIALGESDDYKTKDSTHYTFNTTTSPSTTTEKANANEVVVNNNGLINNNRAQNLFRGRVLDNSGQALPFAKIKINDQLSTYTDVSGNFILVSSDTTMTIEVKSVGYVANQTNLYNRRDNNVQLQEDKIANTQVIATNTNNYRLKRKSAMRSEVEDAPQPQDGWTNYDAYLANNIDVEKQPALQKMKGEVEVEVEVNAEGTVVNAAVTKSLCEKCDAEALRLVKEGPKWKGKKGRKAKVLVRF